MERNKRILPSKIRRDWTGKRQKIEDSKIQEKVETVIPESKLFSQLVEFEKKIDVALAKRKMDVKEALRVSPTKTIKSLRLLIYNTHNTQGAFYHTDPSFSNTTTEPPSWTMRIEGRLLEDQKTSTPQRTPLPQKKKFSSYFRRIFVQLDKTLFPENHFLEWNNSPSQSEVDGFEIKRLGNTETTVKLLLWPDHKPSQFKLSPQLSKLLNIHTETRSRIILVLWQYIKTNKLQSSEDRKTIINNVPLKEIFNVDKMQFSQIPTLLTPHLGPADPIEIDYTIKLSGEPHESEQAYDIHLQAEDSTFGNVGTIDTSAKEIEVLDIQIQKYIDELNQHKRRREFFLNFNNSPVEFIQNVVAAQIRDFKVLKSDSGRDEEEERHSKFYYQPHMQEAVQQYLQATIGSYET